MVIYMRHPIHGQKVAVLEAEAVADEKEGWERYSPFDDANLTMPAPDLAAQYLAKFGHKPHWKMKPETIQKALDE